ncbi:MAG TPA: glycosyltransferase family 2 protein [Candidatus Scalindua sp.]|nr:glycosyltransferase family 2 protein [Candidatus Scalindua sp.]
MVSQAHTKPMASVVVPTLNRQRSLKIALVSLLDQDYDSYEIVVVDQSTSLPSSDLKSLMEGEEKIRHFHIKRPGLVDARNFGVKQAKGEIIIFCDDDVVASPSWVTAHVRNYHEPVVGAVAGRVFFHNGRDTNRIRKVGKINWRTGTMISNFDANFRTEIDHVYGCNFSFRKRVFLQTGGFDRSFNYIFDDADMSLSIKELGHKIIFAPEAVVEHVQTTCGGLKHIYLSPEKLMFCRFRNHFLLFWKHLNRIFLGAFILSRFIEIIRWAKFYRQPGLVFTGIEALLAGIMHVFRMSVKGK